MSPSGDAARRTVPRAGSFLPLAGVGSLQRLPMFAACTVLALIVNYASGKEMAWDTLNYHLYAGFSAVNDRFGQDYFAAGPQSYLNPYAYVPFYALVHLGLGALLIGSLLAAVHSIILWLTFELALTACPSGSPLQRSFFGACAVALAAVNPVLLQQIGSSFADITTAELALGGWLLLAAAIRGPSTRRVVLAGMLLGTATALKQTNAVHAVAAAVLVLAVPAPLSARARYGAFYGVALGVSFALISAPWSYRLARMFGNPFFPLLNNIFRAPEFTAEPLRHLRFIPASLGEALWRPFAMLEPARMVHEEPAAPDLRYAVLLLLAAVAALCWLWRRTARGPAAAGLSSPLDLRVLGGLGCAFALDWSTWLFVSGNSRYFLPAACVGSVLLAGLLFQLFAGQPKARNCLLAAVLAAQAVQLRMGSELRWDDVPWNGSQWFEVEVPETLRAEPSLYLTMGTQSNSFLAPYLAPGAGLVNFSGGYPLGTTGANGQKVNALIQRYRPRLRVLVRGERLYADDERRAPSRSEVDGALERFSLRIDPDSCMRIAVHGLPPELEITFAGSSPRVRERADATYLVSCGLVPDLSDHSADLEHQRQADLVLDRLEDACPALFQPRRPPTDMRGGLARRQYINTDLTAWVSYGRVKFLDLTRGQNPVQLGRVSDWLQSSPPHMLCARRDGQYVARILNSQSAH